MPDIPFEFAAEFCEELSRTSWVALIVSTASSPSSRNDVSDGYSNNFVMSSLKVIFNCNKK
jgi:hypothetical protein